MTVSNHYAREHFDELESAIDRGEIVEISRGGQAALRLVRVENRDPMKRPIEQLLGLWSGKLDLSRGWDSPELNAEIASEFEGY